MRAIGLDIGGANLKIADPAGSAKSIPFALWKRPGDLIDMLRTILQDVEPFDVLAVTMTGELCDCFATKREGVYHILDAVNTAAGDSNVRVWQTDGRFVTTQTARERILQTAAANWHALATFAAKLIDPSPGWLIDIGSTTTDIIPLQQGTPIPQGLTDTERLAADELVYTGVGRTPVCAVASQLKIDNTPHRVAAEFFAALHDAYLLTGDATENPDDCDTADGRPATIPCAAARIARMICADTEQLTHKQIEQLAQQIIHAQESQIANAIRRAASRSTITTKPRQRAAGFSPPGPANETKSPPDPVPFDAPNRPVATAIISGSGEFLAARVTRHVLGPNVNIISFAERFGPEASNAACAFALAKLAAEPPPADDH